MSAQSTAEVPTTKLPNNVAAPKSSPPATAPVEVDIRARVIYETHWATPEVVVPPASTLAELNRLVMTSLPSRRRTILWEELTAPRAILQELTEEVDDLRFTKYIMVSHEDKSAYSAWYEHNI
jgi:hypothetical protein